MAAISYALTPHGREWVVVRNGVDGMSYATQEAAFEAAASGDLRLGHSVAIEAPAATDPAGALPVREKVGDPR